MGEREPAARVCVLLGGGRRERKGHKRRIGRWCDTTGGTTPLHIVGDHRGLVKGIKDRGFHAERAHGGRSIGRYVSSEPGGGRTRKTGAKAVHDAARRDVIKIEDMGKKVSLGIGSDVVCPAKQRRGEKGGVKGTDLRTCILILIQSSMRWGTKKKGRGPLRIRSRDRNKVVVCQISLCQIVH